MPVKIRVSVQVGKQPLLGLTGIGCFSYRV